MDTFPDYFNPIGLIVSTADDFGPADALQTVINADRFEDEKAGKNQIAISSEIYDELVGMKSNLLSFFKKGTDDEYIAVVGYQEYLRESAYMRNKEDTKNHSYNGAWNE